MVGAVIGAYLYLRIVVSMWMEEPTSTNELVVARPVQVVIGLSVAATLIVGIFPNLLLNAAELIRFAPR
jgi:NADH:ubiquinone oxidoreductase subunit 2 (subunit N)